MSTWKIKIKREKKFQRENQNKKRKKFQRENQNKKRRGMIIYTRGKRIEYQVVFINVRWLEKLLRGGGGIAKIEKKWREKNVFVKFFSRSKKGKRKSLRGVEWMIESVGFLRSRGRRPFLGIAVGRCGVRHRAARRGSGPRAGRGGADGGAGAAVVAAVAAAVAVEFGGRQAGQRFRRGLQQIGPCRPVLSIRFLCVLAGWGGGFFARFFLSHNRYKNGQKI